MALCSIDSHLSFSLKVLEGNIIWPITLRKLKCHPITAFMKTHANLKKYFCLGLFWFKYIFAIKFKIRILDLILCRKNSVSFEGQYYSTKVINLAFCLLGANFVVCLMIFTKRLDPDHA